MESFSPENNRLYQERLQKKFEYYKNDFPLTEQELQGPLLDVGASNGEFVEYLREFLHNKDAKAVEFQEQKIKPENAEWHIQADGLNLPFEDDSFDTVTAHNYLPIFVDDREEMEKAITELIRVVKPTGRVMGDISTPESAMESAKEIKENLGDSYNEQVAQHAEELIQGAKNLALYLQTLSAQHTVQISGVKENILIITK